MSARTLPKPACLPFAGPAGPRVVPLSAGFFQIRRNGIEFQSSTRIPEWTEMTVEVRTSASGRRMHCTGVVVACHGNRHTGYQVAMLFTGMSRHSRAQLDDMAVPLTR
jgi:hypothetical protein